MIYGAIDRKRPPHKLVEDEWCEVIRKDKTSYKLIYTKCNDCGKMIVIANPDGYFYPYEKNGNVHSCKKTIQIRGKYGKITKEKSKLKKQFDRAIENDTN